MTRAVRLVVVVAIGTTAAACSAILGLGDLRDRDEAGREGGTEASVGDADTGEDSGASSNDGAARDATADAENDASIPGNIELALGETHTCVRFVDNKRIKCWGSNAHGELGLGDSIPRGVAAGQVAALPYIDLGTDGATGLPVAVAQVAIGGQHSCALLTNGRVKCWGDGRGDDPNEMGDSLPYLPFPSGLTATKISAGEYGVCALFDDATARCWGGNVVPSATLPAVDIGSGRTVKAIQVYRFGQCALLDNSDVKCWGNGGGGALGYGDEVGRGTDINTTGGGLPAVPVPTAYGVVVELVPIRGNQACVITAQRALYCWGLNNGYQLGTGDDQNRGDNPGEVAALAPVALNVDYAGGGYYYGCLHRAGEGLRCWGDPFSYGDGIVRKTIGTTDIDLGLGASAPTAFAGGVYHACAAVADDAGLRLKCWGMNDFGQLGLGDKVSRNMTAQLGTNLPLIPVSP